MEQSLGFNWNDAKSLDETADTIARCSLMACDREPHGFTYPTRKRFELLLRGALTPQPDQEPGDQRGISLKKLCSEAWERIHADAGEDIAAEDLLMEKYEEVLRDGPWVYTPEAVERVVEVFASFEPTSLWTLAVQAAYPEHPQTPGSAKWMEAEAKGNPHESVANPWTRKP